jgi:hypothetical protein
MSYLIASDFKKLIQSDNLTQIIGGDTTILTAIQQAAQSEAVSYLTQKYITGEEFTTTDIWNPLKTYVAKNRLYLDASGYVSTITYSIGALVLQDSKVYICITATTGLFDVTKWTLLGIQGTIFYVKPPASDFNVYNFYKVGDVVFWRGFVYTCINATKQNTHNAALQSGNDQLVLNIFPDDTVNGPSAWGNGVAFSIAPGTLPTDATKWTQGDNRNPQLVNYCIDIALYHIHSRIAPRNIPELRVVRYTQAIEWLQMAGQGKITADLPLIQPRSGGRIRHGGEIKRVNSY